MYSVYLSFKFTYSFNVSFSDFITSNSLKDFSSSLLRSFKVLFSSFIVARSEKNVLFPLNLFFM